MKNAKPGFPNIRIVIIVLALIGALSAGSFFKTRLPLIEITPLAEPSPYQQLSQWPAIDRPALDADIEARIDDLLRQMTLKEKVSQMTQGEIDRTQPAQLQDYPLGSIFSGGGRWPNDSAGASVNDWLALADRYWLASKATRLGIPVLWGVDAVHGHNNVDGATLFPHNLALGATANADLVEAIAAATAGQVKATGLDWTFAPTTAVVQDPRWGRTYESFSQDSNLVYRMTEASVRGLQQDLSGDGILATAKHFIGDGGTVNGIDQGDVRRSEKVLMNIHGQGYYAALENNVQTVMVSFSSWRTKRMHEHQYLITDVLKQQMGFDGLVVSDYNGIAQAYQCSAIRCPAAVNAGIDLFMVPSQWRHFIDNTVQDVLDGHIPESRINDAVRRILRVKFRAGLFDKPRPSERAGAGDTSKVNSPALNRLARQAVRESLVLLKNNDQTLPLDATGHYLVLGMTDSISRQSGGWSVSWQGHGIPNYRFGDARSFQQGLLDIVSEAGGRLTFDGDLDYRKHTYDGIILLLSERSYAEGAGDIRPAWMGTSARLQTGFSGLEEMTLVADTFPEVPLTVVYVGGRPLWLNPQINAADAFVMAWLPGTQGAGIADGLFGISPFTGRLPLNWPGDDCARYPASDRFALFPIGYGLSTEVSIDLPELKPTEPSTVWGTNNLAPACMFHNVWTTLLH